jgi:hypothetical protein
MIHLHAERVIPKPADEVAEFFFDATNNPRWQRGMKRCEWQTPPPIGIGSIYEQEAVFMDRPVISTFQVVEYQPLEEIRIETLESTFPIAITRSIEPIDASTSKVQAEIQGSPSGLMGLLGPLTRRLAQRSVDADYDRLVEFMSKD